MSTRKNFTLYGGSGMVLLLVGPSLLLFVLFVLWPAVDAIFVSMSSWTGFSPTSTFTGLENYRNLWSDSRFWKSFAHTLYFVLLGGIGHFVFAFLFASALNNPRFCGKKIFQTLIFFRRSFRSPAWRFSGRGSTTPKTACSTGSSKPSADTALSGSPPVTR